MNRRALLASATAIALGVIGWQRAAAQEEASASQRLQLAAETMNALESVRWKVVYVDGSSELFGQISLKKAEGAYRRPDLLVVKAETKAVFLSVDLHALSNGDKIWIDAAGFSRTITPSESLSIILSDPLAVVAEVLLATENPVIAGVFTKNGQELTHITGTFNSALVDDPAMAAYLEPDLMLPVEIVLDTSNRVVSAQQSGAVVGYDSDNVVRRLEFWDYDAAFTIEMPE